MRRLILHDTNDEFIKFGALRYKFNKDKDLLEIRNMDMVYKYKFNDGDYIYIDFTNSSKPVGLVMSPNEICKFTMWAMGVPSNRRHLGLASYIDERLSIPKTLKMLTPKEELNYCASMAVRDGGRTTIMSMVIRKDYIDSLDEEARNEAIAKVMINYPKGYNLVPFEHLKDKLSSIYHFSDELLSQIEKAWDDYWVL